jgi:CheY-like chemotaxis protein
MNGYQATTEILEILIRKNIPIIAITAGDRKEEKTNALT